jgi:uncharacterized protein with HEPN domain
MPRDSRLSRTDRLEQAIESCDRIGEFISGLDDATFIASRLYQNAVCLELMQIAEVLKPLDDIDGELRHALPELGRIFGMRNLIAHEYRIVDMSIVWLIASMRVPELRLRLAALLNAENGPV